MIWTLIIPILFLLGWGIYWSCFSKKCILTESQEEDESEKRIYDLEKQIQELNNKVAYLDGRFYVISEPLKEKK